MTGNWQQNFEDFARPGRRRPVRWCRVMTESRSDSEDLPVTLTACFRRAVTVTAVAITVKHSPSLEVSDSVKMRRFGGDRDSPRSE